MSPQNTRTTQNETKVFLDQQRLSSPGPNRGWQDKPFLPSDLRNLRGLRALRFVVTPSFVAFCLICLVSQAGGAEAFSAS
jgi:hypothetical protein